MKALSVSWMLSAALVVLASGAWGETEPAAAGKVDTAMPVKGNTAFALDLYGRLRSGEGNLFLSPVSISTALGMTYAGARTDTAKEMAAVLRLPEDQSAAHAQMGALLRELEALGKAKGCRLDVANSLWGAKAYPFLGDFLATVKKNYGANLQSLDFAGRPDESRLIINGWVEDHTEKRIKDLIPPGMLQADTKLVLTNAVYFKANWATQFDKARTLDMPFNLTAEKQAAVPMMRRTARLAYMEGNGFQALELPYAGDAMSMVVFLPGKVDGLAEFEKSLSVANLDAWLKSLAGREVSVFLPRFTTTVQFELSRELAGMGMPLAFSRDGADFSGMTGGRDLFISNVVHKAFVDVNEEGTEAAAATGVMMRPTAIARPMEPLIFRADHPFLFLLRDRNTGSIIFMGRIVNPKA